MVEACREGLPGNNGYSPSYGLPKLRSAIAGDETSKGWNCNVDDVYVYFEVGGFTDNFATAPKKVRRCALVLIILIHGLSSNVWG